MKSIAVMIRRKFRSDRKLLKKEIMTQHRKLKKNDKIITLFSLEQDDHKGKYHSHLIIQYNDEKNLFNQLNRFIGGNVWITEKKLRYDIQINNGMWGEIHVHDLYDEEGFKEYMKKYNITETLF